MSKEILMRQLKDLQNTDYFDCLIPGATLIMEESRDTCPVDTGNLRDSHSVSIQGKTVDILVEAEYAGAVEYGTERQSAQPYLRPAIDNKAKEASELIGNAISARMKEVVG
jgi:HK97 gp10 family phage protein